MEKPSVFETVIEWINWIKIVLSPTILCAIIGVAIYLSMENKTTGIFLVALITAIGLGLGILWANKIKRNTEAPILSAELILHLILTIFDRKKI